MRTQDEILRQAVFSDRHLIHARMTTDKSLFEHQHDSNVMLSRNTPNLDNVFSQVSESTFPMMVKLIHCAILGLGDSECNIGHDGISHSIEAS